MGRARIDALLAQLEANQQRERVVDAAIFTVAQVAVNELQKKVDRFVEDTKQLPG